MRFVKIYLVCLQFATNSIMKVIADRHLLPASNFTLTNSRYVTFAVPLQITDVTIACNVILGNQNLGALHKFQGKILGKACTLHASKLSSTLQEINIIQ